MKRSYFTPLIWFIAPTVLIGYGIVIPGSCIGGVNQLSVGFASSLLGACGAYWLGLRTVLADRPGETERTLAGHG
jgi:hypothetical protein